MYNDNPININPNTIAKPKWTYTPRNIDNRNEARHATKSNFIILMSVIDYLILVVSNTKLIRLNVSSSSSNSTV